MRPSISVNDMPPIPDLVPFEIYRNVQRTFDRWPDWQLDVICGMLGTMDTLSIAGQKHLMRKIVEFFRSDTVARKYPPPNDRQRRFRLHVVEHLERECGRPHPDARLFGRRAARLVSILRTTPVEVNATAP